jgi:hypothetical protein
VKEALKESVMKNMHLPHWFVQKLSDDTLLRLDVLGHDVSGVYVRVDSATATMWRRVIAWRKK